MSETAQILDDDRADLAALDHRLHPPEVGTVEIRTGVAVVSEEHGIPYPIFVKRFKKNTIIKIRNNVSDK